MTKTIKKCLMTATLFVLALVCFGLTMNFTFAKADDPAVSEYETKFIADVDAFVNANEGAYYVVGEDGTVDAEALKASFTDAVAKKIYDANLMLSKIPGKEYITRATYLDAKAKYDNIYTVYKTVLNVLNANASEMYDVAYKTNYATYSLWTKVVKVRTDYDALSEAEKTCFNLCSENGTDNLVAAEAKIASLKANINAVITAVENIKVWNETQNVFTEWKNCNTAGDNVDTIEYVLGTEAGFEAVETAMAKIAADDMQYVKGTSTDGSDFDNGLDYEALYEAAKTGVAEQKADIKRVVDAIDALTTGENAEKWVTIRAAIEAAETAYAALDGSDVKAGENDLKGAVTNYAKLTEKRTHLDETDAKIATLVGKIDAIGEVVYDYAIKAKIVEAEGLFNELDKDVKDNDTAEEVTDYCVSNYATLVAARTEWDRLVKQIVDIVAAFTGFIGNEDLNNENFVKDYTDAQNTYKALQQSQIDEIAAKALNFYNNNTEYKTEGKTFYADATYQPVGYDKVVENFKDLMIWFDKCKADVQAKADEINNAILELYGMYNANKAGVLVDPIIGKFQRVSEMVYTAKDNAKAVYNAIAYLKQFKEVEDAVKAALDNTVAWIEAVKAINSDVEVANFNLVEAAMAELAKLNNNTTGIDYSTALSSLNLAVSEEDATTYKAYWTKYDNAVNARREIIEKIIAAKTAIKIAVETEIPAEITGSKDLATAFINAVTAFNANYATAKDLYDALTADEKAYVNAGEAVTTNATADYEALVLVYNTLNTELAIANLEVALVNEVTTDVKFVYNETNLGLYNAAVAAKNAYEGETAIRNVDVLTAAMSFKADCDAQITAFVNKVNAVWAESYVSEDAKLVALKIKAKIEDMVKSYNALNEGKYVDLKLQDYVDMTVTETVDEVTTYVVVMDKYNDMVNRLAEINALITAATEYIEANIKTITEFTLNNKVAFDLATEKVNALVNEVKGELVEGENGYNVANITANVTNYAEYERVMAAYKALLTKLNASMTKVVTLMEGEVEAIEATIADKEGNYNVAFEINALYVQKEAIETLIATYDMTAYNHADEKGLAVVETILSKDLNAVAAIVKELGEYTELNAEYVKVATEKMAEIEMAAKETAIELVENTIIAVTGTKLVLDDLEVANAAFNALHETQQALVNAEIKDLKDDANGKLKFAAALDLAIENLYKLVITNGDVNNVNLITFQVIDSVKGMFSDSEVDELLGNADKLEEIRAAFKNAENMNELTFNDIVERITALENFKTDLDDTYATDEEITTAINAAKEAVLADAKKYVDGEIAKLGNTYATIEALNTVATNLNTLKTTVENLNGTYATDAELAAKVTELTGAIATAKSEAIAAAKKYVDDEIAKLNDTYATDAELLAALNTLKTELSNDYKKLVNDEIKTVTDRITALENRVKAAEDKAAAEEAARKALEERLAALEAWKKKTEEGCNGSVGAYGIAIAVIALAACAVVLLKKKFN